MVIKHSVVTVKCGSLNISDTHVTGNLRKQRLGASGELKKTRSVVVVVVVVVGIMKKCVKTLSF